MIPAGTPIATPVTVDCSFPPRTVERIDWTVPPGARGNMGWYLASGGVAVLPSQSPQFVVTDNERSSWSVDELMDSGAWQLIGYNLGAYDHTVYLTFMLDVPGGSSTTALQTPPSLAGTEVY